MLPKDVFAFRSPNHVKTSSSLISAFREFPKRGSSTRNKRPACFSQTPLTSTTFVCFTTTATALLQPTSASLLWSTNAGFFQPRSLRSMHFALVRLCRPIRNTNTYHGHVVSPIHEHVLYPSFKNFPWHKLRFGLVSWPPMWDAAETFPLLS